MNCNGGADGTITATATGGTATYQYSIDGGNTYVASPSFTGLSAGPYTVDVVDQNGCTATANITVLEPTAVTISLAQDSVNCFGGNDGNITVTGGGGVPPYQYVLDGGTPQSMNTFTGLTVGNYLIDVIDSKGCQASSNISVLQPTQVSLTVVQDSVTCFGGNDGSITVTGAGGTPTYTYAIDGGAFQTSNVFSGLVAGQYTITIRDLNDCTADRNINVLEPQKISTTTSASPVSCWGGNDGSASVSVTGGLGGNTYQWSNAGNGALTTGLSAGWVYVTVTDVNGCTAIDSALVTTPDSIIITETINNVSCFGGANGSISLSVTGGTPQPTYQYQWAHGPTASSISGLGAGTYTVTVTDGNNCTATGTYTISQPTDMVLTGSSTAVLCAGDANGTATVDVTGGTPNYSYAWNTNPQQNTSMATGLTAGLYLVTVTDANGCQKTLNVDVPDQTPVTAVASGSDPLCTGYDNGSANVVANGGVGNYTYSWSHDNTLDNSVATDLEAGTYTVTVTDGNGCTFSTSVELTDPAPIAVTLNSDINDIAFGRSVQLTTTLSDNVAGTPTYTWDPSELLDCFDCADPIAGPLVETTIFTVEIEDENGCMATDLISINVDPYDKVFELPNAFTPNNDGENDDFRVYGYGFDEVELMVFNRWGELVYRSNDFSQGWDGTYKGQECKPDVYVYVANAKFLDGRTEMKKGSVTLIR